MEYKHIILIVFGIASLIYATVVIWKLTGIPKIHRKMYRIKIVKTRKETTYYPQYRNYGWCNFQTLFHGVRVNVSFSSLEEAEDYITRRKLMEEDQKETVTYKYL